MFNYSTERTILKWGIHRELRLEREVRQFLETGRIPKVDDPIFILDRNKKLLYTNMARHRHRMPLGRLKPIKTKDGKILGYINFKGKLFRAIEENKIFVDSLINNLLLSSALSILLSLVASYIISKKIAKSAIDIKRSLKRIEIGEKSLLSPSGSREIYEIGQGVNTLSRKLANEYDLRNQWLHDISHDLKTPLSALKLQHEGMLQGILSIDRDRVQSNKNELDRLESLIMGINDLMRFEAPDLKTDKKSIQLSKIFKELYNRFKDVAKINNRSLEILYTNNSLYMDYSLMFKGLSNLLDNAIRYSHEGSKIVLGFDKGRESIYVESYGETIAKEIEDRLFDRLYRGDKSRNSSGSGLGLSIVKAIVDRHSGTVSISSVMGVTRFYIKI